MKFTKLSMAILAAAVLPVAANATLTVTPALLGYYNLDDSQDKQAAVYTNGTASEGFKINSDLYTSAAVGVELTPSTQFQVEYGVIDTHADNAAGTVTHDAQVRNVTGNFLIGTEQFTGYNPANKLKPYLLIGGGETTVKIKDSETGDRVMRHKDTIGNVGIGARYEVNDVFAVRGEARGIYNFENKYWDSAALAGLEVSLGKRSGAKVEAPVVEPTEVVTEEVVEFVPITPVELDGDQDGDGVPDSRDACPNTPRNVAVDARGCPEQVQVQENLQLELRVFFDYDKSDIKPQYRQEVAKVAAAMREFPNSTAQIEGHASKDSARSNARYNQRLSEARANAVRSMLVSEFGVPAHRLSAVGYGFDRPVASNDTAEGRATNRRVIANIQGNRVQTQTVERQR